MKHDPKTRELQLFDPDGWSPSKRLSVSQDWDDRPDDMHPVLLYVPDMNTHEHHHIQLSRSGAEELWDWLGKYLGKK